MLDWSHVMHEHVKEQSTLYKMKFSQFGFCKALFVPMEPKRLCPENIYHISHIDNCRYQHLDITMSAKWISARTNLITSSQDNILEKQFCMAFTAGGGSSVVCLEIHACCISKRLYWIVSDTRRIRQVIASSMWDSPILSKKGMKWFRSCWPLVGPPAECGGVQRYHGRCGQGQPVARCFGPSTGGVGWRCSGTMHCHWFTCVSPRHWKTVGKPWMAEILSTSPLLGSRFGHIFSAKMMSTPPAIHWSGDAHHHAVDPRRCQRALLQLFDRPTLVTHRVRQAFHCRQEPIIGRTQCMLCHHMPMQDRKQYRALSGGCNVLKPFPHGQTETLWRDSFWNPREMRCLRKWVLWLL